MKCSRTIAYAIDAIVRIARQDAAHPIPCSHLAKQGQLPPRFLLQVLRSLVNSGVLRSIRGTDGGYLLARPPNQISILNVVQAFDNALDSSIPATSGVQFEARVKLLATLRQASAAASEQLHRLTIADIMDFDDLSQNLLSQNE